jgi:hypothetical protein
MGIPKMSNESEAKLEARVAGLEAIVAVLVERTKDDDESFRSFSERINEYGKRSEQAIAVIHEQLVKKFADDLAQFGARLHASFAKDVAAEAVAQVTSEKIADSLSKKILVTRPATREEAKSANVVVVRNATSAEVRKQ